MRSSSSGFLHVEPCLVYLSIHLLHPSNPHRAPLTCILLVLCSHHRPICAFSSATAQHHYSPLALSIAHKAEACPHPPLLSSKIYLPCPAPFLLYSLSFPRLKIYSSARLHGINTKRCSLLLLQYRTTSLYHHLTRACHHQSRL